MMLMLLGRLLPLSRLLLVSARVLPLQRLLLPVLITAFSIQGSNAGCTGCLGERLKSLASDV